jgi:hypothetical protein
MSPDIATDGASKADSAVRSFFNQYIENKPLFEKFLVAVENKCRYTLAENEISHFIESRVKDHQSLGRSWISVKLMLNIYLSRVSKMISSISAVFALSFII